VLVVGKKILVVEDDTSVREVVVTTLQEAGFTVVGIGHGLRGLDLAKSGGYDLAVLDVLLPGCNGTDICRELRRTPLEIGIIMLTDRGSEADKVLGLELGADDYLTKPFSPRELVARVRAVLRRSTSKGETEPQSEKIILGDVVVDPVGRSVTRSGKLLDLTVTEFDLLFFMAKHLDRAFSRGQLLQAVWGYSSDGYEATVNTHINRLRAKIELDPADPRHIQTVRGVGYKCASEQAV
jgi:DNA-binding response OmpR family regulator